MPSRVASSCHVPTLHGWRTVPSWAIIHLFSARRAGGSGLDRGRFWYIDIRGYYLYQLLSRHRTAGAPCPEVPRGPIQLAGPAAPTRNKRNSPVKQRSNPEIVLHVLDAVEMRDVKRVVFALSPGNKKSTGRLRYPMAEPIGAPSVATMSSSVGGSVWGPLRPTEAEQREWISFVLATSGDDVIVRYTWKGRDSPRTFDRGRYARAVRGAGWQARASHDVPLRPHRAA